MNEDTDAATLAAAHEARMRRWSESRFNPDYHRHDGAALDYAESEAGDDDGLNLFRGIVNAIAITGLFVAAFVGFAVIVG